jgi:hypothetical protein
MLVFFVLDRSHASVLIAWICFSSPYQSCSPGCGAPRPFLFGLKPSTGLVGSIPAGAARWLRVLFFLFLSSYPRVRSAVSVHFFSQFLSLRVGSRSVSSRHLLTRSRCTARAPNQIFLPLPRFCAVTSPAGSILLRA